MNTTHPLLLQPEGKTLEFKRDLSSPQNLLKTLVAFANSAGGGLVIGVDDARRVVGVSVDGVIASIAEFTGVDSVIHARPPASLPQHCKWKTFLTAARKAFRKASAPKPQLPAPWCINRVC